MVIKRKHLIRVIFIPIIFIFLSYLFEYLSHISKSYNSSIVYIRKNVLITNHLGKILSIRRQLFQDAFTEEGPISGCAKWCFIVKGEKAKGEVCINLEKELGKWYVKKAILRYNGKEVDITNGYEKDK